MGLRFDKASFKDPSGRVFYQDDKVCRILSRDSLQLIDKPFFVDLQNKNQLVSFKSIPIPPEAASSFSEQEFSAIEVRKIPTVTYSYEWSFDMLKDAANLTLDLAEAALAENLSLKDATAFNILFEGCRPTFIDLTSFELWKAGAPWKAYSQFCRSFLFPLMIESHLELEPQSWLSANLGEISLLEMAALFRNPLSWFKPGVFKDVILQAKLQEIFSANPEKISERSSEISWDKNLIQKSLLRLRRILSKLKPRTHSQWSHYVQDNSYVEEAHSQKLNWIEDLLKKVEPRSVLDLGSNTGKFTDLARAHGAAVVAIDSDPVAINFLYQKYRQQTSVQTLVVNIAKPSPAMGWALQERASLLDRIPKTQMFFALALIHHLRISSQIPLDMIIDLLFRLGGSEGVIEWVEKTDPMVKRLLALREDVFSDYSYENFLKILESKKIQCVSSLTLAGGTRRLCYLKVARA